MPHSVASDLGLHCLPATHLGVSSLQWAYTVTCIKLYIRNYFKLNTLYCVLSTIFNLNIGTP